MGNMEEEFKSKSERARAEMSFPQKNNILLEGIFDTLIKISSNHDLRWLIWLKKHKWATIITLSFGLISIAFSITQITLVAVGMYYYPEETRALFQTVLDLMKGAKDGLIE